MPEQLPPPLSSAAPICAYPPSTLPSPTNIPSSPPQVPSTLPSPTSYPSSPTPPPPSTLPSPTSNPFTPPPPTPSTLPSPTSPPPPFLPAQVPPAPPCLPTQVPPPTLSIPPPLQSSPPTSIPTPPAHNPTVPVMPYTPPPMGKKPGSGSGSWCVSKPTVSDAILQRGLDYACGMGADCKQIQPGGPCFQPNTVSAHSSFAFNSYWQKGKAAGGTCDFGGTAMIVTIDPSKYTSFYRRTITFRS
ncbi:PLASMODESMATA CALLOSE-BINDING PROTEIN 3 [Linum grandiflorum]